MTSLNENPFPDFQASNHGVSPYEAASKQINDKTDFQQKLITHMRSTGGKRKKTKKVIRKQKPKTLRKKLKKGGAGVSYTTPTHTADPPNTKVHTNELIGNLLSLHHQNKVLADGDKNYLTEAPTSYSSPDALPPVGGSRKPKSKSKPKRK